MEPGPGWVVVGQAVVEFPQAIRVVVAITASTGRRGADPRGGAAYLRADERAPTIHASVSRRRGRPVERAPHAPVHRSARRRRHSSRPLSPAFSAFVDGDRAPVRGRGYRRPSRSPRVGLHGLMPPASILGSAGRGVIVVRRIGDARRLLIIAAAVLLPGRHGRAHWRPPCRFFADGARGLQGLGAGMMIAAVHGVIREVFRRSCGHGSSRRSPPRGESRPCRAPRWRGFLAGRAGTGELRSGSWCR